MNNFSDIAKVEIASYRENKVGKTFKRSKVEYIYEFFINGVQQIIKIIRSFNSGKIRVKHNDKLIFEDKK